MWIRASMPLHCMCCDVLRVTCVTVAWRDYDGEFLLKNLPVPNSGDSTFKLSPLWVYLFTHVSPLHTWHVCFF